MPNTIRSHRLWVACLLFLVGHATSHGQTAAANQEVTFGPYEYEVQPDHPAFVNFRPRLAPERPATMLLRQGDRLAICGDSITEQKMYSRIIETYLTVCLPEMKVTVRQYGWSGEKTGGFLRRMEQDCLTFKPTIATLAYGMNDSRYRPFDTTNGRWYEDHYTAIVRKLKQHDARVVVGSPGCAGKIAAWVKTRAGTLEQHNLNLCALRDIALGVAVKEDVRFADIFWPMLQAQVFAPEQHQAADSRPYNVAGKDGIHPGWAGHVVMAWSMLRALGVDGNIGEIQVGEEGATASGGHAVDSFEPGVLTITSKRYPFCAGGDLHDDNSIRSGMTLVPFTEELNRFVLKIAVEDDGRWEVEWGGETNTYSAEELRRGVNLAWDFPVNPFSDAFRSVDEAVAAKQAYETQQVKRIFHGQEGHADFAAAVESTEKVRQPLADAIATSFVPVTHTIKYRRLSE